MTELDDELRIKLQARYDRAFVTPDVQRVLHAARRRSRRVHSAAVLAALASVLGGAVAYGFVANPADKVSTELAAAPMGVEQASVVATPERIRLAIKSREPDFRGSAEQATLLADSSENGVVLRVIGIRQASQECIAVYQDEARSGAIGLTCGAARDVTSLELARGTGDTDGVDRLSGLLPAGAAQIIVSGDGMTKRVPVIDATGGWQTSAFVTSWPAGRPVEAVALDAKGVELFSATL